MLARTYKIFTWLSLDVTAGAIVFMYFLSKEFGTPVEWSETFALGLSVWLIYTADHLLDAKTVKSLISPRRIFHHQYVRSLLSFGILAIVAGIWVLSLLSRELLIYGIIMALIAGGYLIIAQLKRWSDFKELQISLGYTLGVSLIPLVHIEVMLTWHWLAVILLFLLALFNLILFSWFERDFDRIEGFRSFPLYIGEKKLSWILWIIASLSLIGSGILVTIGGSIFLSLFFIFGTAVNFILWKFSSFFGKSERYRIVGDAVFMIPLLSLL